MISHPARTAPSHRRVCLFPRGRQLAEGFGSRPFSLERGRSPDLCDKPTGCIWREVFCPHPSRGGCRSMIPGNHSSDGASPRLSTSSRGGASDAPGTPHQRSERGTTFLQMACALPPGAVALAALVMA